jgi:hypothetical protein
MNELGILGLIMLAMFVYLIYDKFPDMVNEYGDLLRENPVILMMLVILVLLSTSYVIVYNRKKSKGVSRGEVIDESSYLVRVI